MSFFSKISKCISSLFSKKQEPAVKTGTKRKKTAAPPPQKAQSDKTEAAVLPRKNRQKKTARKKETFSAPVPEMPPPVPESLKDVPVQEGKLRFLDLPLHESLQFALQDMGFEYCTPIQEQALPLLLQGFDVAGKAQTGTGKTAAFLLALFQRILSEKEAEESSEQQPGTCRAIILAPTRELAIQIHKDAGNIAKYTTLRNVVVFGGMDFEKQKAELNAPVDLLIGTPGRVIDYARRGLLKPGKADFLVLDEADRMLDMGFIPDVRRIVGMMPGKEERQTLLFSATLSEDIMRLAANFQRQETVTVESEPDSVVGSNIEQTFYSVAGSEKLPVLCNIIKTETFERMLIFGNRKDHNLAIQSNLLCRGIECELLSGDIPQQKRLKILERFRAGSTPILIATDVAARGIHVDDVNIVINYDLPEQAEDYVHRIGRTGRAGRTGKSISFVCEYGAYTMPAIEKLLDCEFSSTLPPEEMLQLPPVLNEAAKPSGRVHTGRNNGQKTVRNRRKYGKR